MTEENIGNTSHIGGKIMLSQSEGSNPILEVRLEKDTVWLSQRQMAALFDKNTDTIRLHIRNIFKEGELEEVATTEDSSVVQEEGGRKIRRRVRFYNFVNLIARRNM